MLEGPVGDVEGLVAEGLLVEGPVVDGEPEVAAPEPVELLPPELLCAVATPPDSSKATSATADVTFIVVSMVAPEESTNRDNSRSARYRDNSRSARLCRSRWKVPNSLES